MLRLIDFYLASSVPAVLRFKSARSLAHVFLRRVMCRVTPVSTAKLKDRGAKASMKVEDRILKVMYLHYEENPKVRIHERPLLIVESRLLAHHTSMLMRCRL